MAMIIGAHILLYTKDPAADRAFFRDVLGFRTVDVGHGWLIFAMPPAEAAFHPMDDTAEEQAHAGHTLVGSVLYLMCDNLQAEVKALALKKVTCTEISEAPWGIKTTIQLPSGGEIGLYQPRHQLAFKT
jgi:catechol 2,3-dioxygenase-like lactoylglutathione lyase family enzyme